MSLQEEKTPYQELKEILDKNDIPLCELSLIHNNILLMLRMKDIEHSRELQRMRNELRLIQEIEFLQKSKLKKRLWLLSTFCIITTTSFTAMFFMLQVKYKRLEKRGSVFN